MNKALKIPTEKLPGVGEKMVEKLKRLGIKKAGDFITHFPHRYEDFSNVKKIKNLKANEKATVTGKIIGISSNKTWKKRMTITEAVIEDETGSIKAVWFNQPYLTQTLKRDTFVNLSGKVAIRKREIYLSNPAYELIGKTKTEKSTIHTGGLVPIYPETRGLTSRWLRFKIKSVLDRVDFFEEFLPEFLLKEFNLLSRDEALRKIHFPKNDKDIKEAKKRLGFEELFLLQLFTASEKEKIKSSPAPAIETDVPLIKDFIAQLSFDLTNSQRLATWQILKDIEKSSPMNRLLEGDVGSGKTVVGAIASLNVIQKGWQVAFIAPTEVLANQHFKTIQKVFENFHQEVGLLTSSQSRWMDHQDISKKELIEKIKRGEIKIVIGTHALIQKEVRFSKLGLVIVDEQHRFGIEQRAHLIKNQKVIPHLLSMTATPIPRTLALTVYGDLDLSLIKEMPKGRKKIITKVVAPKNRSKAYDFIRKEINKGRQAFVICPLVEESQKLNSRSVEEEYQKLSKKVFPQLNVQMLHGRMKSKEKEEIMNNFKNREADVLISTAVVEVGVDIPNASVMMIEGSDRFGLSQLHQFRGRVGRSDHQSYCFLFTDSSSESVQSRLEALLKSEDGFSLAQKDLELRGPGEFLGSRQSGLPDLAMSSLKDIKLIEETQEAVKEFMNKTSLEEHPQLQKKLEEFQQEIHWE